MTDRDDSRLSRFVLGGRWRFRSRLGGGADGVVYLARDEANGQDVAIKVYESLAGRAAETIRNRLATEAAVAERIRSPYLVDIRHWGTAPFEDGGEAGFMVMEYLEGDTLRESLERRVSPMAPGDAAALMHTVLGAVAALHRHGFVHRDLKPENIFLLAPSAATTAGVPVKLIDFGTAMPIDRAHAGIARGTPIYCAPEIARRAPRVGTEADVYTLGIILYELLTGRPPLDEDSTAAHLVSQHAFGSLDPLPPDLAQSPLAAVYRTATARGAGDRYPNADAMAQALDGLRGAPSARLPRHSPFSVPAVADDDDSVVPGVRLGDPLRPKPPDPD